MTNIVIEFIKAANLSLAQLRSEISNVRYKIPIGKKGGILFKFREQEYEAPEPYPEMLLNDPEAASNRSLALKTILNKTAYLYYQ